jgi:hypothetical protein
MVLGLPEKVFAASESDFEPDVFDRAMEIRVRIAAELKPQRELRQQRFKKCCLMLRRLWPLAATVELAGVVVAFRVAQLRTRA